MKKISTFFALLCSLTIFAQSSELAFYGGVNYQPVLLGNQLGFDFHTKYYFPKNLSVGLQLQYASQKHSEGFGFNTDRTMSEQTSVNALIQYDLIAKERFVLGAYLANGVSFFQLKDLNDTRIEEFYNEEDGIWYKQEVSKKLNTDAFYMATPGINCSIKLATLSQKSKIRLYANAQIAYQLAFGKGDVAKPNDLSDFIFSSGIAIRGALSKK